MTDYIDKCIDLIKERHGWRDQLERGEGWHEPDILSQYRVNRDSTLWRASRQAEKLCEYILFLESKLNPNKEKFMVKEVKELLDGEAMINLLRSNLSHHYGKNLDMYSIDEITQQIIESIYYLINQKSENA